MTTAHAAHGTLGPEWLSPAQRTRLVRLCARLTGDGDAAEDLAQETLLEAWRHAHRLADAQDQQAAARWLAAIARNVCLRWMRQHGREKLRLVRLAAGDETMPQDWDAALAQSPDPTLELERGELAALLDRAMAMLPAESRQVLVARYIEESPQAEVALRLGLSEGAVAVRLHRGRLAMRRLLAGELRDEASTYDMLAPSTSGWQTTSIWCPTCGQHRLLGRFRPVDAQLVLRCPVCHIDSGTQLCDHISHVGLFDGISGYKPALSRVLRWTSAYYRQALADGQAPCLHCWRPVPLSMGLPAGHPLARFQASSFHVACAACRYPENNGSLDLLILGLPEGRLFWRDHPRIRTLPEREVEANGRAALVIGFESVANSARLEAVVARASLEVLSVQTSPSGL